MIDRKIRLLIGMLLVLVATNVHAQLSSTPGWHRISSASPSYGTAPCGGGAQSNATYMDPANFPNNLNSSYTSYGFNFPGECQSFINDSNGGVLDTTRHRLILYGGGHSNYWGNDIVDLELTKIGGSTTPMFHLNHSALPVASVVCPGTNSGIVTQPSGAVCSYPGAGGTVSSVFALPGCTYATGCSPSEHTVPASGHTYQGIAYIPPIFVGSTKYGDEMLNLLSSTTPNGNGAGSAWVLEMNSVLSTCAVTSTATAGCDPNWIALGSGPAGNNFYLNPLNVGMVAAYDPNAKGVWMQDQAHLQFYDPVARTVTTKSSNGINDHATGVIDPIDNYFIFVGDNVPIRYERLVSPYTIVTPTTTGCSGYTSLSNIQYSGAAWDPISRTVMIYPNQGNVMYRLDPKTWTCTAEMFGTTQGVDYPQNTDTHLGGTEGTFGHFQYDPALDVFVMCNLYNDDCWYLVPPRGDPLICNGTWSNGTCSGGSSQTNTPITVSQPFKQGDIPSGVCPLVYQDSSGTSTSTSTQTDAKNFWPDGSLKFGMISFIIPSMAANQVVRAVYRTQTCPSNAGFMTKANMLTTTGSPPGVSQNWNFDGQIQLTGTASHNISARTILNAATSCTDPTSGDIEGAIIASECVYWLKGPIVTAVILTDGSTARSQDVNTDGNTGNPLHPIFEAWFWPQTGDVQLGYTLENAWASNTGTNSARDQTFSLALTAGSTSPVTLSGSWGAGSQSMITRTVFHRTYCANGAKIGTQNSCSPVTIDHDYPYLAKTLFFPNWDPTLQQNSSYVATLVTAFNAAGTNKGISGTTAGVGFYPGSVSCGASNTSSTGDGCTAGGFNQTGAAYFHGPLTTWEIICLMTSDPSECGTVNIGNSDLGYEVPYFFREADTGTGHGGWFDAGNANSATPTAGTVSTFGRVVSINNRTQVNLQSASVNPGCNTTYLNDFVTFGTGGEDTGAFNGNTGTSHWANLALVSYVFTGQYAYYEEQMMQAAYAIGQAGDYNPTSTRSCYQPTANASLRMGAAGYWQVDQERGNDWSARENALGAFLAIDGSPESAYFTDKLKTNLAVWEGVHSLICDLGVGGVTYSYCTGSGSGTSQSAWSYGNTSRVTNSNAGGTILGSWAIGPAVNNTGGYEIQYPFCFQTTGTGAAGVLNPNLTGGGLSTPVTGAFFQNGDCPTAAPTTPPQAANSNFQNAYSTVTIGWIKDLGFCPGTCGMLQYVANFWINAAVNPAANPFILSNYAYPTLDKNGNQFASWTAANDPTLYVANGAPTGWIARQGTAGCPSGTSGAADEWFNAESTAAASYVASLTENFSGSNFLGTDAYNLLRNADAIQICFPYFTNTGLSAGNFGSPKWDIVPRAGAQGSLPPWSGLIDNNRAPFGGWSNAGVQGGIPSASWTQCLTTACNTVTSTWPTTTGAQINSAITSALNHTFVFLPPGTDNINDTGIVMKSHAELRAQGADQTFLIMGPSGVTNCGGIGNTGICFNGSGGFNYASIGNFSTLSSGFNRGSNVLQVGATSGLTAGQTLVELDQCSPGNSGFPCTTNPEVDNNGFFPCEIAYNSSTGNGCAVSGPDNGLQRVNRGQAEWFLVSALSPTSLTLSDAVEQPDYATARSVGFGALNGTVLDAGVKNLSIDVSAVTNPYGVALLDTFNVWVRGLRIVKAGQGATFVAGGAHNSIVDNYFFGTTKTPGTDSFGMYGASQSHSLFQNNIFEQMQVCMAIEAPSTANVYGYNYCMGSRANGNFMYASSFQHGVNVFDLIEGNVMNSVYDENIHGPKIFHTIFRNLITGWESCQSGASVLLCGSATFKLASTSTGSGFTTPIRFQHHSRYGNVIDNVLGTPGIHNLGAYSTATIFGADGYIYELGTPDIAPTDPIVAQSVYRWYNWDAFNNSIQCNTSEVPTTFSPFGQPLPTVGCSGTTPPASLYLGSNKPSWFGTLPWPSFGSDVTGGNIGQCTGTFGPSTPNVSGNFGGLPADSSTSCPGTTLATAWGGHANANPAMHCALDVMHLKTDGSDTNPGSFNADACYGNVSPVVAFTPSPVNIGLVPQNLTSNPVSVTLQNTGSGILTNTSITLSNSLFTIVNNTCGSPSTITNLIPGTGFTLVAGGNCTFQVTASPTAVGNATANAVFTENTATGADTLVLNSTGTGPPAPTNVMSAGAFATHTMCPVRTNMTQLCFAEDCNCWWVSMSGAAYTPFGVNSVNGKSGNVVLSVQ